jgi:hypothetical protein
VCEMSVSVKERTDAAFPRPCRTLDKKSLRVFVPGMISLIWRYGGRVISPLRFSVDRCFPAFFAKPNS